MPVWWVLFSIYCGGFGLLSLVRVLVSDPTLAVRVPTTYYQLLMWHVICGSVAMILAWLQVWPHLRASRPRLHRRIGQAYLALGVIPAGLLAIPVSLLAGVGHAYRMSLFTLAILWLASAWFGYRNAVRGDFVLHRRWMLRNVALTTAIITARPFTVIHWLGLSSLFPDKFPIDSDVVYNEAMTASMWKAVVVHLVIVEWVILRPRRRAKARAKVTVDV